MAIDIDYWKCLKATASVAVGCGVASLSTLIHECGHAFMAKVLSNQPINIRLGGYDDSEKKFGCFTLSGFNPFRGACAIDPEKMEKASRRAMFLAGPCAGAAFSLFFSTLNDNEIYKLFCFLSFMVNISDLYPYIHDTLKSDGAYILEDCIKKENADVIITVCSNVIVKNVYLACLAVLADSVF